MADEAPKLPTYDPARTLTFSALFFIGFLILFVALIIGVQIVKTGSANTESWAALTGLIGWAMGTNSSLYNNRFGSTQQSAAKDATIEQQARTAAVIATAAAPAPTPTPPSTPAPITTDTVTVDAQTAVINTDPPTQEVK